MKTMFIRSLGLALTLAAVSTSHGQPTVIYANNTTPFGNTYLSLANGSFVGDTIALQPNTFRNMVGFSFEYYTKANTPSYAGNPSLTVGFYLNDGAITNGVSSPSTLLKSETFNLSDVPVTPTVAGGVGNINFTNAGSADFPLVGGVLLTSDTITWTVQVSGLGSGDVFGLVAFDPPTVGGDGNYYWQNVGGVWNTYTNSTVVGANNFGAEIWAVPEPGTVSLLALCGFGLLIFVKRWQQVT